MWKKLAKQTTTGITGVTPYEAMSNMEKLRKIKEEKGVTEQITPSIYTEKKDGVLPGYDIRTDRFEVAREAMEKLGQAQNLDIMKSQEAPKTENEKTEKKDAQ